MEMRDKQAVAHGNYKEGQAYLKSALRAAKNPAPQRQSFTEQDAPHTISPGDGGADSVTRLASPTSQMPACRQTISYRMPEQLRLKLGITRYDVTYDNKQHTG